ncbi:hypothetical protein Ancab_004682, partial [Ancistrocladus abbreviatus]
WIDMGRSMGFVRFMDVHGNMELEQKLSSICVTSFKIRVSIARARKGGMISGKFRTYRGRTSIAGARNGSTKGGENESYQVRTTNIWMTKSYADAAKQSRNGDNSGHRAAHGYIRSRQAKNGFKGIQVKCNPEKNMWLKECYEGVSDC